MAFYLAPIANNSQITATGAPLSGGSITTYAAGTTTLVATYTDNTGGTPQANPVTLNTQGLPASPVWLQAGQAYKFLIKDSLGNTIRTIDNVVGIDDPAGMGIKFPSDGTFSFRNRIHNGNFVINQRAVSGTVTLVANAYGHDRWKAGAGGCTYTFATVGNVTVITISAGSLMQIIDSADVEGGVYSIVNQGTAQARYAVSGGATSGGYFTASSAAPLQTTSASANQTVAVEFSTGTLDRIQVEPGVNATSFERRPKGVELALCQRYYQELGTSGFSDLVVGGIASGAGTAYHTFVFPVRMRASPTATNGGAAFTTSNISSSTFGVIGPSSIRLDLSVSAAGAYIWQNASAGCRLTLSSDL